MASSRWPCPGKLLEAEPAVTSVLIITEPLTWSRLKVVYSFEYDGTLAMGSSKAAVQASEGGAEHCRDPDAGTVNSENAVKL